jgi:hypothetical protein
MMRHRTSKLVATGLSVSATLAGVGLIAHADDTASNADSDPSSAAPAPTTSSPTTSSPTTSAPTSVVVTSTTVLDVPGAAVLATKTTDPALAIPVSTFETIPDTLPATTSAPDPTIRVASSGPNASGSAQQHSNTPATTAAPTATAPPDTQPPVDTTPAAAPPPETTAAPPPETTMPPATLPPLTAPPDETSRGTQ